MSSTILIYIASVILILWGIAHIIPTKKIAEGLASATAEQKAMFTMEWIIGGLYLIFLGALVLLVTLFAGKGNPTAILVYRLSVASLVISAGITWWFGRKTRVIPIRICPFVQLISAILILLAL
jgi:hypothetical protein